MLTKFYQFTENELSGKSFEEGAIYVTTDTYRIYSDPVGGGSRTLISGDPIILSTEFEREMIISPIPNKLYFVSESSAIYVHNNGIWHNYLEHIHADWNQSDETARDFIKNRTHYEDTVTTSIVLFDGDVQFDQTAPGTVMGWYDEPKEFENGKTYTVTIENEQQDIVCEDNALIFVSSELNTTFTFMKWDILLGIGDDPWESSYYIKIETEEVSTVVKQLDEKYIPDAITRTENVLTKTNTTEYTPAGDYHPATKKYVDDSIADSIPIPTIATVGQVIVVKAVDENSKPTEWEAVNIPEQVQSDWSQTNETAVDFIKNKPSLATIEEIKALFN